VPLIELAKTSQPETEILKELMDEKI